MPVGADLWPIVLSAAVLAILLTAPLGALGIDLTYKRLLQKEKAVPRAEETGGPLQTAAATAETGGNTD